MMAGILQVQHMFSSGRFINYFSMKKSSQAIWIMHQGNILTHPNPSLPHPQSLSVKM